MIRYAMLLLPALLLSACGGGKTDERDTAAGKILPGSASDAMLQTDRLQSEAPLAAPKVTDNDAEPGEKRGAAPKSDEPDEEDAPEAVSSPAPTAAAPAPAAAVTPAP
jgi:hypothetical protein